jgi:competence protein ComEC
MALVVAVTVLGDLPRKAFQILALAFLAQLAIAPASGVSISFVLSYLALAGILVISGPLAGVISGRLPALVAGPLATSVGAFCATMAVCAGVFGMLHPVGIVAGLLLVPLTSVFMVGAAAYLVIALAAPPIAVGIEWGLSLVYKALEAIVSIAGAVPGIETGNAGVGVLVMLGLVPVGVLAGSLYAARRCHRIAAFGG